MTVTMAQDIDNLDLYQILTAPRGHEHDKAIPNINH